MHETNSYTTNVEWLTPPEIITKLGEFDLDPCTPTVMPWQTAKNRFTKNEDGLAQPWQGRVFLNPPYGPYAQHWLRKLAEHGNGIALVPARTETKMFFESVWSRADGVCFLKGRPHFHHPDGTRAKSTITAPVCLIAYGADNLEAIEASGLGVVVRVSNPKNRRIRKRIHERKNHDSESCSVPRRKTSN